MHEPRCRRSNPQAAVAIADDPGGIDAPPEAGPRIRLDVSVDESADSAPPADQQSAVVILTQAQHGLPPGQAVEPRGTGLPTPQPVDDARPEAPPTVLVQSEHSTPDPAVLSVALDASFADRTEPSGRSPTSAGPDDALPILEERKDELPGELRIRNEAAVLPTDEPLRGADPQGAVAVGQQAHDVGGGKILVRARRPRDVPDAIEAQQA